MPNLPSQTGGTTADVVSQFVLRMLIRVPVASMIEAKPLWDAPTLKDLVLRHCGIPATTYARSRGTSLVARCRRKLEEVTGRLEMLPITSRDILAMELAHALQMSPVEQSLLRLAVYVADHPDIRLTMDLMERVDSRGSAAVFAAALGLDTQAVHDALVVDSPMRRAEFVEFLSDCRPSELLAFPGRIARLLARQDVTANEVLSRFFGTSPQPKLTLADFSDQAEAIGVLRRYLAKAVASGHPGVNVLVHGRPGTGKTELSRALSADLGLILFEVATTDDNRDPLPAWRRVTSYVAAQQVAGQQDQVAVLFDEIEDVFSGGGVYVGAGRQRSPQCTKGWMNHVLESNVKPAFWISNDISRMGEAHLRRFDVVLELKGPGRETRQRMVNNMFKDLPLSDDSRADLTADSRLGPGQLERMARVLRIYGPVTEEESEETIGLLTGHVAAGRNSHRSKLACRRRALTYRPECVNADVDLGGLIDGLRALPAARLCLYGPSGTGKTEWGRYLAEQLGKPLHLQRASDLMGMYVGQTEKRIRRAFEDAEQAGAVLLIDEADSLIRSREQAHHGWEMRMVNEFLTCMEEFEGIFVATTNLRDQLDAASTRRFDFKIRFNYLSREQRRALFNDLTSNSEVELDDGGVRFGGVDSIDVLTHGDFANVARQIRLRRQHPKATEILRLLRIEIVNRIGAKRSIGFIPTASH